MAELAEPETTVSAKIRALDAAGAPRAEIARFLGKRYQHVRNVLEADKARHRSPPATGPDRSLEPDPPHGTGSPAAQAVLQSAFRLEVDEQGRIALPPQALALLRTREVPVVMGRIEEDGFVLIGADASIRRVQALAQAFIPDGPALADTLIAARREEARRDGGDL